MKLLTPRKIRFSLVSITATTIDFAVLLIATSVAGLGLIQANYISSTCGFIYSFVANKKFTFKTPNHRVRREALLYIGITLIGIWVIQPLIIWPMEHLLIPTHWPHFVIVVVAKITASLVTFVWNYFGYSRIVFKKPTGNNHPDEGGS